MLEAAYQELQRARTLIDQGEIGVANELLQSLLATLGELRGEAVMKLQAFIWGDLAQAAFFSGAFERAQQCNQNAYELCLALNDQPGVENYEQNLYELLRYGDTTRSGARLCAERMSVRLQRQGRKLEADAWRRKAAMVEHEPPVRVQALVNGRCYELDELPRVSEATVHFVFERNRITLPPARKESERARALANAGQLEEAERHLRSACRLDAYDPESRMLLGLICLDQNRWHEAVDLLEEADHLGPGFFHVRSDLWFARRLSAGRLAAEFWELWRLLEDGQLHAPEKLALCERVLSVKPNQAGVLLHQGRALQEVGRDGEARQAFEEGLRHAREAHLRTRLLLSLGSLPPGNPRCLKEAVLLNGDLISAAMARWLLLNSP